ncbi:MAG: RHS repeat-associated core domain-containing protein, partial [Dehalococcoidia bacterium]|nr:RHS repeat-associated core domain-containing protein [Dehalococcoidia bacterium]
MRAGGVEQTALNYTGQRLDATGLLYYHARYYDPALGRFISPDSIVPNPHHPQALNRYAYV